MKYKSSLSILIFIQTLFIFMQTIANAQCLINPECFCQFRRTPYDLTCSKIQKVNGNNLFISLKFNKNLTNAQYDILVWNKNYTILPNFIFRGININKLSLQSNEIEYISDYSFSDMEKLEILDLSRNNLKSIDNLFGSLAINFYQAKNLSTQSLTLEEKKRYKKTY